MDSNAFGSSIRNCSGMSFDVCLAVFNANNIKNLQLEIKVMTIVSSISESQSELNLGTLIVSCVCFAFIFVIVFLLIYGTINVKIIV
jgi:hypothetical protein